MFWLQCNSLQFNPKVFNPAGLNFSKLFWWSSCTEGGRTRLNQMSITHPSFVILDTGIIPSCFSTGKRVPANLYVFKWYFLSRIMWGALERMAFRRIFPAWRIFSEGTCPVEMKLKLSKQCWAQWNPTVIVFNTWEKHLGWGLAGLSMNDFCKIKWNKKMRGGEIKCFMHDNETVMRFSRWHYSEPHRKWVKLKVHWRQIKI